MRSKWLLISVLAVCAGIAGGALSLRYRHRSPEVAEHTSGAAVISKPEASWSGTIRPQHVVNVGARVNGNIETFMADVGQEVFQGQVLARIGAGQLESDREAAVHSVESAQDQVSKAEAAISSSRMEASRAAADAQRARMALDRIQKVYSRQQTLHDAGATPRLTFEKAQQDFEAALQEADIMGKAERAANDNVQNAIQSLDLAKQALADHTSRLDDAQGAMEYAEVRSPVDGLIVGRKGDVGKPAEDAGDALFQIATDVYALEVIIEPPSPVLKRIHPGQQALVSVLDLQTGGMPGEVKEVKDKEGQVIVEFNSTVPAIRPGMRADVRLKVD